MNVFAEVQEPDVSGFEISETAQGLDAIHTPNCAGVLWKRSPDQAILNWMSQLAPEQLPHGRVELHPDAVRQTVEEWCHSAAMPLSEQRTQWVADVADLADCFARIMRAPSLRLRLDRVSTNACRKFHMDAIKARLICTYRGTGTQYGTSQNGEDPMQIVTAVTGCPMILRGSLWPTSEPTGLRHRSPPIEGSGETRLLLVLDPIYDVNQSA